MITNRQCLRMPCELSWLKFVLHCLSAATLILICYALLSTAALGNDVHPGRHGYGKILSCRPLQAVHPVCAHEMLQAILVLLAQLGQYAV